MRKLAYNRDMKRKTDHRPWGEFIQFTENEPSTIKLLIIKPHESLSLQYHHRRNEFWRILQGNAQVTIGEDIQIAGKNSEFTIPQETKHRIKALDEEVVILEIATGEFHEDDIVRLEDTYGRH